MCRLLLYIGQPIVLSRLLVEPVNSLINQSVHCASMDTPVNGDGFGVAWYAPEVSPEPGLFRSLLPAWSNNNLHRLAAVTRSGAILAHVRAASPGLASAEANCHPFTFRELAFAHNGDVGGFRLIRRGIESALSDQAFHLIGGNTDSEHLFALLVDRVLDGKKAAGVTGTAAITLPQLAGAMRGMIADTVRLAAEAEIKEHSYINAAVTNGSVGVACRFSTDLPEHTPSLYTCRGMRYVYEAGIARMEQSPETRGSVAVASEPLGERHIWTQVPHNHIVLIDGEGGLAVEAL